MQRSAVRVPRTSSVLRLAAVLLAVTACAASGPAAAPGSGTVSPAAGAAASAASGPAAGASAAALTGTAASLPDFTGSAFPARATGWLLGTADPGTPSARAQVWHTGDAGATWRTQWAGAGSAVAITAAGRRHAWALIGCPGSASRRPCRRQLIATSDGGRSWRLRSRLPSTVSQVQFASATFGVATTACRPAAVRPCPGKVLVSHDGGVRWAPVLTRAGPLFATAAAGGQIWAAQVVPGGRSAGVGDARVHFLAGADEGRSWRPLGQLTGLGILSASTDIILAAGPSGLAWASVFDQQSCAMHGCGAAQLYQSSDGGASWAPARTGSRPSFGCGNSNVVFSAARGAVAWAAFGRNGGACAPPLGRLYRHGTSGWKQSTPIQLAVISSLSAVSANIAYAITDQNAVVRTSDGGHRWTQLLPVLAPAGQLDALDASTALAAQDASDAGAILRTADGGRSWRKIADLPGIITQLAFPDAGHAFALTVRLGSGSVTRWRLWRSGDEGRTWRPVGRLPEHARSWNHVIYGMWMAADGDGLLLTAAGGAPWEPGAGASGPVRAWTTGDRGARWARGHLLPVGSDGVGAVTFASAGSGRWVGWLIRQTARGSMRLEATADLGRTLTPVPGSPPVTSAQLAGPAVGFAWNLETRQQGPAQATAVSLHETADGGRHWRKIALVISRSGSGVPLLDFADASHGWLVTGSATWHTADAGRTWHRA